MQVCLLTRGGGDFGMGHCYRTRWLAEALREQSWCEGLGVVSVGDIGIFWQASGLHASRAATQAEATARVPHGALAVLDWLETPAELLRELRQRALAIVRLDDPTPGPAELTINSLNVPLDPREHVGIVDGVPARTVSGAQWLIVNPYLVKLRGVASVSVRAMEMELRGSVEAGPVHGILISLSDAYPDAAQEALHALAELQFEGRVTVMPTPTCLERPAEIDVQLLPRSDSLPYLLAASDLLVCHDGITLHEATFLGIPAIVLPLWQTGARMAAAGACSIVAPVRGPWQAKCIATALKLLFTDSLQRGQMSAAGMKLFDGRGLERTVAAIAELLR